MGNTCTRNNWPQHYPSAPLPTLVSSCPNAPSTGIRQQQNQLLLEHSPLYRNEKLKKLFDTNTKEPEEATLDFMLVAESVKFQGRTLEFMVKGKCPLRVWVVENAKEVLHPPTNLSVRFQGFSMVRCVELLPGIANTLYQQKVITDLTLSPTYSTQIPLTLIIQQLGTQQSIYMIYTFQWDSQRQPKQTRQKLDRCGLSFSVDAIYGSMYGQANCNDMEKCAICLTNDANTLFVPCRHMCICDECGKTLIQSNTDVCPICRKPYHSLFAYNRRREDCGR